MIRRLVEAHYFAHREAAAPAHLRFWFRELRRTPELLVELGRDHPGLCRRLARVRPALMAARAGQEIALADALLEEERHERAKDRQYWAPLRAELERLRHVRSDR